MTVVIPPFRLFYLLLFIVFMTPFHAGAQPGTHLKKRSVDSTGYYQEEINKVWRHVSDSVRQSEEYISLVKKYEYYRGRRRDYLAYSIFFDLMHSNYNEFNRSIALSGFPGLKNYTIRYGIGMSRKKGRFIGDLYFYTFGFSNQSKSNDKTIKASLDNFVQADLGIDLLKSAIVSIYPYAGVSMRSAVLEYSRPREPNPNYTNISNIIITDPSVYTTSTRVGYQAGLGIDVVVGGNKTHTCTSMLFVKGGTSGAIGTDSYKIQGYTYKPGIKQGDWLVTLGYKFGFRR